MASSKDIFEPATFAAHSFASGTWRGEGVDQVIPITIGGLEYTVPVRLLEFHAQPRPLDYSTPQAR